MTDERTEYKLDNVDLPVLAVVTSDKKVIIGWESLSQATMWLDSWLAEKRDRWGFQTETEKHEP